MKCAYLLESVPNQWNLVPLQVTLSGERETILDMEVHRRVANIKEPKKQYHDVYDACHAIVAVGKCSP